MDQVVVVAMQGAQQLFMISRVLSEKIGLSEIQKENINAGTYKI